MRIAHSTVVSILRLMESKGFIWIAVSERDKRMKIVTLTGQEESFVQEVIREGQAMEKRMVRGVYGKRAGNAPGLSAETV